MTLDQFNKLKEQVTYNLNRKVTLSQKLSQPYEVALMTRWEYFRLQANSSSQQQLEVLTQTVAFANKVKGRLYHTPQDDGEGRVGNYTYTALTVMYDALRDEVTEELVKTNVHKALKSIMKLDTYSTIDCRIMQLFKDGEIDWDTVVKSHKIHCSL
ncbi:MAG: hypothetical protein JHC33_08590 [Ignisphaera sp.]|nr:hypothetical protein [Ignisphaera sp.]